MWFVLKVQTHCMHTKTQLTADMRYDEVHSRATILEINLTRYYVSGRRGSLSLAWAIWATQASQGDCLCTTMKAHICDPSAQRTQASHPWLSEAALITM